MARMRMVTRTVEVNTFTVMTCDTTNAKVENLDYKVGPIPANTDTLKYLKKLYETDTAKLCAIVSHKYDTVLYGMPEDEFIRLAKVLPPRAANADE